MGRKSGYIIFQNDQFDWLTKISGVLTKREMSVLMVIIRFTFGFNRKEARLSGTYISNACGIRATHVPEALSKLSDRNLIEIKRRHDRNTNTIRFDWQEKMKVNTPETGVSILPKREVKTSRNGYKLTPETGDKTIEKTKQKYNTEGKKVVYEDRDSEFIFNQLV